MGMVAHILTVLPVMNWILDMLAVHGAHHPSFGCVSNHDCSIFTKHIAIHITLR